MSEQVTENKPIGPFNLLTERYRTFVQYEDASGHESLSRDIPMQNLSFVLYLIEWINELLLEKGDK